MTCDLLTVFTRVGGGHKSAALAVAERAREEGMAAESRDIFDLGPRLFGDAYLKWHLETTSRSPKLYGRAYFGSNQRGGALEPLRLTLDRVLFRKLLGEVERIAPRVIVATHHIPLVVLGRARRKGLLNVPVIGVVTDYTAHAVWAERGVDAFCTASALPTWELYMHGVAREKIVRTGIPVRPAFEHIARVRDPLASEPLRVLVTSGGFGVGPLREIVRSCAAIPNVALTVVCGASEELRARVAADLAGTNAHVIGFERDMPARVADAHVVVGKAGGLTVSETLTAGRPMIIVGTVPGNEQQNENFVTAGRAGYACAPHEVGARLAAMRASSEITAMGSRARALVTHASATRVLALCNTLAPTSRAA
ncbi:MAG TPA: glycosyltransferase [Polyangiaceae bacterium]|jgi:processive 1,2-diacylglycerol beta-glucosyltransferase|nr:glycosyltransferase [Polyangiaceae bacterium]